MRLYHFNKYMDNVHLKLELVVLLITWSMASLAIGQSMHDKKVLILNSYHAGFKWTDDQVSAAKEVLLKAYPDIEVYTEYMDTKRHYSVDYLDQLRDIFWLKYRHINLDSIITTDDNALNFIMKYHEKLFSKAPVGFCGINDYNKAMLEGKDQFTGLVEVLDIHPTLDLALKLHPMTRNIVVVVDNTATGIGQRKDVVAAARSYKDLNFRYLKGEDLTNEALFEALRRLSEDSIVLLTVWLRDKNNTYMSPNEAGPLISSNSTVPVYGIIDMYLGHGIVGGKLLNSSTHGKTAAEMAVRILGGEKPSDIPILIKSNNPYMFDYGQLRRWKIKLSDLPEDAIVINKPFSLYNEYRQLIWGVILVILVLLGIVAILLLNIIRRKKAEEALRENEERLRTLITSSSDAIISLDTQRRLTMCNPAFLNQFGYTDGEVIGKSIGFIHPSEEAFTRFGDEVYPIVRKTGTWRGEGTYEKKNGSTFIMETVLSAQKLFDGRLSGYTAVMRDLTERKQFEDELKKSERRFREFAEMLPEVVFEVDVNMNLTFVNRHAFTIFGFTEKDFEKGLKALDMLVPEDREKAAKNAAKRFRGEELGAIEYRALRRDGTVFPVLLHASPVIHQGAAKGIRGVIVDMTEQKKAQKEIIRQKRLFETTFNTIPDGVVITNTNREIQLANRGMESTFGYKPDELLGKTTEMLYANKDRFRQAGQVVFDKDAKKHGDLYVMYYRDKTGREFPGETFGAKLFDENNEWIGNLGIMRDITEREQAQKRIQHVQKMEALGTLAGGIAHDFNNVLAAIMGYTELALDDIPGNLPRREHLEQVLKSGVRAKNLIQQILGFSRRTDPEKKQLQLAPIIKETMNLLRATTPTTIEIIQEVEAGPHTVLADPTQIHQLVMNLCSNAAHAMRERGGILKISLKRVDLEETSTVLHAEFTPGVYNRLTVSDTGKGMDKETVERIFEPFFTTKETGQGTGMGLAVAHGVVKAHGGTITVNSEAGKGSTFHVYLPLMETEAEKEASVDTHPLPTGKEHILFVDDEELLVGIGQQMLERLGYQVTVRTSSIEALEVFKAKPDRFGLIITDQTMPTMSGLDLAKAIHSIRPDIPIILCTGYSSLLSGQTAEAIGVKRVLMKPLGVRDLAAAVRGVLDGE